MQHFDYDVGKFAGSIYANGKKCANFPKAAYAAAKGGEALIA